MLTTEQAVSIINSRRDSAVLNARKEEDALLLDKTYSELKNRLRPLVFEKGRRDAYDEDSAALTEEIDKIKAAIEKRKWELGYAADAGTVRYICTECEDTGFVDGRSCECLRRLISDSLQRDCGRLLTDIKSFSCASTDIYGGHKKSYEVLFAKLQRYIEQFPYKKPYMVLSGGTGTGKSFTASVLCNAVMEKGLSALFINAVQLNELFLKRHLSPIEEKETLLAPFMEADLLVIDDLGSESVYKNVTATYLYLLIMQRVGKNTVFTTNITDPQDFVLRYENRVASRLTDTENSLFIYFDGEDLRKK